ncbi:hypothetical protein [Mesobacillus campisalis]|uniref:hypothetical protein n=1 Tax=Mesobacillus campisalis TaxID=1408103 RepID=UPI000699669F|nr:hypothetical protein [Mesobacillus campisalis]
MTILNYLGCNFILPYSEDDSDNKILIMESISGDEALASVKKHFTTKYVYQLFAPWGSGIWFNSALRT